MDVEYCPPVSSEGPHFPPEAAKAKEAAQNAPNAQNTLEYHEIMEGSVCISTTAIHNITPLLHQNMTETVLFSYRGNDTWSTTIRMEESRC